MYDMYDETIDKMKKEIDQKNAQQAISKNNLSNYNDIAKFYYIRCNELIEENTILKEKIQELNQEIQLYSKKVD